MAHSNPALNVGIQYNKCPPQKSTQCVYPLCLFKGFFKVLFKLYCSKQRCLFFESVVPQNLLALFMCSYKSNTEAKLQLCTTHFTIAK